MDQVIFLFPHRIQTTGLAWIPRYYKLCLKPKHAVIATLYGLSFADVLISQKLEIIS